MRLFLSPNIIKLIAVFILSVLCFVTSLIQASYAHAANQEDITEFNVRESDNVSNDGPYFITPGSDGNLWFTKYYINKIGKITPKGKITEYEISGGPADITEGYGSFWVAVPVANKLMRVTPGVNSIDYPIPTTASGVTYIELGSDGNIWFTESSANKIGRLNPNNGAITEFDIPTNNSGPQNITNASDGSLWFTEYYANKIARITTDGEFTEYDIPTENSTPADITQGPDGNMWFTEHNNTYKIGKITPTGEITEYTIPTTEIDNSSPLQIAWGPDDNLWYTRGHKVGRITTDGDITEFAHPASDSVPLDIAAGPDGNVWYTDSNSSHVIGRVNLSVLPDPSVSYVALGDSYSSGFGLEVYFETQSGCQRSPMAYPTKVNIPFTNATYYSLRNTAEVDWGLIACGGNTTHDVLTKQLGHGFDPHNNTYLGLDETTDLITITVGGNDLEFANILAFCYQNHSFCNIDIYKNGQTLADWILDQFIAIEPKLEAVYKEIRSQAPNAKILVLGYPQVFPESDDEQNCTQLRQINYGNDKSIGFSHSEQNFLRLTGNGLNQAIIRAVEDARVEIGNIEFVPVADHFASHEVCGNGGQWIDGPSANIDLDAAEKLTPKDFVFHPNSDGHEQYAEVINDFLTPSF